MIALTIIFLVLAIIMGLRAMWILLFSKSIYFDWKDHFLPIVISVIMALLCWWINYFIVRYWP